MARTLADSRRWMQLGTALVADELSGLGEDSFSVPIDLPGWTRRHLVAHLSANAEAIGRLVHWAATGEPTPMYSSTEQRNADIEAGSQQSGADLTQWFMGSAQRLNSAMEALTAQEWEAEVVTAQGRTVPGSETPWMRAREVLVHAVDLGTGIAFDDLPADFLLALCEDIAGKRSAAAGTDVAGPKLAITASDTEGRWAIEGAGDPVAISGTVAALAAYLAGRGAEGVAAADGDPLPVLPAWL